MSIEIEGLAELSDTLTTLAPAAAKRYLKRAGDKAAEVVVAALQESAPVDIGILEEAIVTKTNWDNTDDETHMTIAIGPLKLAFYGMFREFGTRFQQGIHWMGRGWASCRDKCLDVFATEALGILADLENRK